MLVQLEVREWSTVIPRTRTKRTECVKLVPFAIISTFVFHEFVSAGNLSPETGRAQGSSGPAGGGRGEGVCVFRRAASGLCFFLSVAAWSLLVKL